MEVIRDELRTHSRYIRDNLVPLVACEGECQLNNRDLTLLCSTLDRIDAIPMTLSLLRYSRIEKALRRISPNCTKWPEGIARQAEKILLKWEDELGPLQNERADLWGPGGRLEGVRKLEKPPDGTSESDADKKSSKSSKSSWSVEGILDPRRAYTSGHTGFPVGAWWIKAAAAFRDGIIDETSWGITADEHGAYAIVIKGNEESTTATVGLIRYSTSGSDPGVIKLTRTLLSNVRGVVRVLRSWKLQSPLAPVAGLRYDGLYRVVGYGVTLSQNQAKKDEWKYSFLLRREPYQTSIKEALVHPTADELDDWNDYQQSKNGGSTNLVRSVYGDPEFNMMRRDSGYCSRRPSRE